MEYKCIILFLVFLAKKHDIEICIIICDTCTFDTQKLYHPHYNQSFCIATLAAYKPIFYIRKYILKCNVRSTVSLIGFFLFSANKIKMKIYTITCVCGIPLKMTFKGGHNPYLSFKFVLSLQTTL